MKGEREKDEGGRIKDEKDRSQNSKSEANNSAIYDFYFFIFVS